jgi:hypothetical protein
LFRRRRISRVTAFSWCLKCGRWGRFQRRGCLRSSTGAVRRGGGKGALDGAALVVVQVPAEACQSQGGDLARKGEGLGQLVELPPQELAVLERLALEADQFPVAFDDALQEDLPLFRGVLPRLRFCFEQGITDAGLGEDLGDEGTVGNFVKVFHGARSFVGVLVTVGSGADGRRCCCYVMPGDDGGAGYG